MDEIIVAIEKGLIPVTIDSDLTKPITRAEFAAVSVKTYEALSGVKAIPAVNNPFMDTNDVDVLKAYNVGITIGVSPTLFDPLILLNREQAATMLTRVFKKVSMTGWTLATDDQFNLLYYMPAPFVDDQYISYWARESVYFMAANNIIQGIGNNHFAPQNTTRDEEARRYANATREQALAIAVRMVNNLVVNNNNIAVEVQPRGG
ncbi:MAG: S-layer homology domain-containing protein [Oscillospiraceae bacterium]|nr:S-layer homology domain-containing protein [Oscillospiraceae bacterium]